MIERYVREIEACGQGGFAASTLRKSLMLVKGRQGHLGGKEQSPEATRPNLPSTLIVPMTVSGRRLSEARDVSLSPAANRAALQKRGRATSDKRSYVNYSEI
jgi:hypothetical protein